MESHLLPTLPIPEPLRASDPGSFAEKTVKIRLPAIGRRVIAENQFPAQINDRLEGLIQEIPGALIRPLQDRTAVDIHAWDAYTSPYLNQNWLQVPWFFAETYFYRRILEATGYFTPGDLEGYDPYSYQKQTGLESARQQIGTLVNRLDDWRQEASGDEVGFQRADEAGFQRALASLLSTDLWGNQVDLSLWPAGQENRPDHADLEKANAFLLVDDMPEAIAQLSSIRRQPARVDFLADNAGFELVVDLCLADFLLNSGAASSVRFHLKAHPTFVSDAMKNDLSATLSFLTASDQAPVWELGKRLQRALEENRLQLRDPFFWNSPLAMWKMPADMRLDLAEAGLVILKGDANYRRALGDRHWAPDTPIAGILSYFPAPLLMLRTLKSEVVAGLKPGQVEAMYQKDPQWMTDGRWGVVQQIE